MCDFARSSKKRPSYWRICAGAVRSVPRKVIVE